MSVFGAAVSILQFNKRFYLCWDPFHNVVRHQDNNLSLSVEKQALQLDATLTVKDLIAAISASNTAAS